MFLLAATLYTLGGGIALVRWQGLEMTAIAGLVSVGILFLSKKKIGELTGDGMGAIVELSELGLLFLAGLAPIHPVLSW